MLAFLKRFVFFLLLALALLFGYQNLEALSSTTKFRFDFYVKGLGLETPELPVVFLFVGFFLLGMIAAGFRGFYDRMSRRMEIRRRDRRIRELEKEVADLRSQATPREAGRSIEPSRDTTSMPASVEENPTL
jgi:hypothetical protein